MMAACEYHGKFKQEEHHDWQCPTCEKEIQDFAKWRTGKVAEPSKDALNLLKRGVAEPSKDALNILKRTGAI